MWEEQANFQNGRLRMLEDGKLSARRGYSGGEVGFLTGESLKLLRWEKHG